MSDLGILLCAIADRLQIQSIHDQEIQDNDK